MHISIWLTLFEVKSWNFSEEHKKKLKNAIPGCTISVHKDSKSFKSNLSNTDIALVWVFNQDWFKLAPKLKWIATASAGKDWFKIDIPEGILVTYGGFHGKIIAETVIGAMLSFSRGLFFACKNQNNLTWPRKEIASYCKILRDSHLVILGFGKIGSWIAKLAKPFGVRITGVKRKIIEKPDFFDEDDKIISIDNLDTILPETDHLVLALPSDISTDNLLDEKKLNLLPNHSFIYNIGRGNSIDEVALAKALNEGKIKGAYLDVFKKEPLDNNSPLRNCSNIIITPHSSAIAPNFLDFFIDEFVEKYKKWKNGFSYFEDKK